MRTKQICPHCGAELPKKGPEEFPRERRNIVPWAWQCPYCEKLMQPIESSRKPDLWRILNIVSSGLFLVALVVFIVLSVMYPELMGGRDSELSAFPLVLFFLIAMIPAYIAVMLVNRRLPHRQHWVAAVHPDESLNYTLLHRKPTHAAHFRADTPLFEQDILQVNGTETLLLLRRIGEDTVDFCTVPYEEAPRLPETFTLNDGAEDVAELTEIRAFADM